MTRYADLGDLSEDSRIQAIGEHAAAGATVGVALEKDEPEKIARYVRKITSRFPGVVELGRVDGPVPGVIVIKFGKRLQ